MDELTHGGFAYPKDKTQLEHCVQALSAFIKMPVNDEYRQWLEMLNSFLKTIKDSLSEVNCKSKYGMNIIDCLFDTINTLNEENNDKNDTKTLIQYTLLPLLLHLKNDLYFWLFVYGDETSIVNYRETQVSKLQQVKDNLKTSMEDDYLYDVTIAVTAYNKCEYSKLAIESILKHTDFTRYRVELLLIDNGSTDDTLEFFSNVKQAKLIHLKNPLGYPATSLGVYAAQGKYYVHFANDIIATPNWLDNLLSCIESQSNVGMVVPACNYMSSSQSVYAEYKNPLQGTKELDAFAMKYNEDHGDEWEERVRLLPCMSIMPSAVAKKVTNDSLFYFGEFADDDVSTRLRRAGLRQIFAKGTFVHHFGSVTARNAQRTKNSLSISRKLFYEKWGVDAWSSYDWEFGLVDALLKNLSAKQDRTLWIDPEFCALSIQARDAFYKQTGQLMEIDGVVTEEDFLPDALGIMNSAISGNLDQCLKQLKEASYDGVVFRHDIVRYVEKETIQTLLMLLNHLLKPNGKVLFYSLNAEVFSPLNNLLVSVVAPINGNHLVPSLSLFPKDISLEALKAGFSTEILPAEKALSSDCVYMLEKMGCINPEVCNRNIFILSKH